MDVEPKASPRTQKVLGYRVAVKKLAKALIEIARTGDMSAELLAELKEIARG